jgi:Spy/CpxP family protein refolding chaperone
MTRKSLPIAFYLLLVFVSGAVVGALGYRTYNPPTARTVSTSPSQSEFRRHYIDESRTRLGLTDDQVAKLTAILDDTETRFGQARDRENHEIRQIREDHFARVRTILTPEQVPKYEELRKERLAKGKQQQEQQNKQ